MILRYDQGMNTHHESIDHNHPAVQAAARVGRVSDEAEIAASEAYAQGVGERPVSQRMRTAITAALPHLTADDLRTTPAGKQLMAEGWGALIENMSASGEFHDVDLRTMQRLNPYLEDDE